MNCKVDNKSSVAGNNDNSTDEIKETAKLSIISEDEVIKKIKIPEELVAKMITTDHKIKFYNMDYFRYNHSHYISGASSFIKQQTQVVFDSLKRKYWQEKTKVTNKVTNNYTKEVLGYIERTSYVPDEQINAIKFCVGTDNIILDMKEHTLIPPNPEIFVPRTIPVTYDPTVDCPAIDQFIEDVVTCEYKDTIYETIGYCLWNGYPLKKIPIFYGPKADNGKTTLTRLITKFLGKYNVSNLSMYDLRKNFRPYLLVNKLANIYADLPSGFLGDENVGWLKILSGGEDDFTVEKKFADAIQHTNTAKIMYSSNYLPSLTKQQLKDPSIMKRWLVIPFDNVFPQDDTFFDKITTTIELSGLLNRALQAYKQLMKNRRFTNATSLQENIEYFEKYEHSKNDSRRKNDDDTLKPPEMRPPSKKDMDINAKTHQRTFDDFSNPIDNNESFERYMKRTGINT